MLFRSVRGAAETLGAQESLDVAAALRGASDAAYRAVRSPVEGTMLTAVRELAEEAEAGGTISSILARGDDCVRRTPELLPVLADAGVVDAGAAGLVEIARGVAAVWTGEELVQTIAASAPRLTMAADLQHEDSAFRYCTVFVVEGDGLDADELEAALNPLGDSLLVVGDPTGYGAAVLGRLCASVVMLECDGPMAREARRALAEQKATNVKIVEGDLAAGHGADAPYDVIVLAGAVVEVPRRLHEQLAEGGRLVAVIQAPGDSAKASCITRVASAFDCRAVFDAVARSIPG